MESWDSSPIRLGVSSCLLGERVRYDGGHQRDSFLMEVLAPYVEWVPVCPEVEIGLGTPRPGIRLVRKDEEIRLLMPERDLDLTDSMRRWAEARAKALAAADLSGYVLRKGSPSCGMERVRVHGGAGPPRKEGVGAFARVLMDALPLLPVEEDGRLNDPKLRESFVERIFAYHRLKARFRGRWTVGDVVAFHTAHKLQLMAHDEPGYRRLGRLVAAAKTTPRADLRTGYERGFMETLRAAATPRKHANVLQHAQGHLKKLLAPDERAELSEVIDDYRKGLLPLVVPITLLRHHVRKHGVAYLAGETYLEPHPKELMLRNHV